MTTGTQNALAAGFAEPVFDSQSVFRAVLLAFSRPGRISTVTTGIEPPLPLQTASAAIALSLFDLSTPYWIDPSVGSKAVIEYVGFHSGARATENRAKAAFAILGADGNTDSWDRFAIGTPDYPDRSTTIIVQVNDLQEDGPVRLTGPGIEHEHRIAVDGMPSGFWSTLQKNAQRYPLGTDTVLVAQNRLLCLPRTTKVEI